MRRAGFKGMDMAELIRVEPATSALVPTGNYVPVELGAAVVGYVPPATANILWRAGVGGAPRCVAVADAAGLGAAATVLQAAGLFAPRGEDFDVRVGLAGPVLARVDRGALPCLGLEAQGVHVNGLVRGPDGPLLWVARRAASKALDAGKLDHIVAGGSCAGMDAPTTLVKEAAEEAGLPAHLARQAMPVGVISYVLARPEGLRRDRLHCFDLHLPPDYVPVPRDGEVESFFLLPLPKVLALLRAGDDFKFNVRPVLLDLLARHGVM